MTRLEQLLQEKAEHDMCKATAKVEARRKYQREWCAAKVKRIRNEKNAASTAIKKQNHVEFLAKRDAELLAKEQKRIAKNQPSKTTQKIIEMYKDGKRVGFVLGREFERTHGKNAVTPENI